MNITISRSKVYPTPGKNYKFAWKYIYHVDVPGKPEMTGDTLSWARRIARKHADGGSIIESWSSSK